ncbi:MAG TPA: hypothetical protein VIL04_00665 [Solirubrobacterales bacterium]|jgi:hypothetical protein
MSKKLLLLPALLVSVLLLASCGGDDDNGGGESGGDGGALSTEEYSEQVSDEMATFEQEFRDLGEAAANPQNADEYIAAVEDIQGRLTETADNLDGIEPPGEAEDIHARLTQAFRDLEAAYGGIVEAVESESRKQIANAVSDLQAATKAFQDEVTAIATESEEAGFPIENLAPTSE